MKRPEYLNEEAAEEWSRAGKILCDIGFITKVDVAVFAIYCQAYSEWRKAIRKMLEYGPDFDLWLKIMKESYDHMMKAANLLGLLPSSRKEIVKNGKTKRK